MSDAATYAAIETELVNALATPAISGLVGGVHRTTGLHLFLARQAAAKPAIGVAWKSFDRVDEWDRCATREYGGTLSYEVIAVVGSGRGANSVGTGAAVETLPLYTLIGTIHDRLERLDSAYGPGFLLSKEEREEIEHDGGIFTAAILTYQLIAYFGK